MAPSPGSIHRNARRDSGLARLLAWARRRLASWTAAQAAEACTISPRRCREMVLALRRAGLARTTVEAEPAGFDGSTPAEYALTARGRGLDRVPVMIVDAQAGRIVGLRARKSA